MGVSRNIKTKTMKNKTMKNKTMKNKIQFQNGGFNSTILTSSTILHSGYYRVPDNIIKIMANFDTSKYISIINQILNIKTDLTYWQIIRIVGSAFGTMISNFRILIKEYNKLSTITINENSIKDFLTTLENKEKNKDENWIDIKKKYIRINLAIISCIIFIFLKDETFKDNMKKIIKNNKDNVDKAFAMYNYVLSTINNNKTHNNIDKTNFDTINSVKILLDACFNYVKFMPIEDKNNLFSVFKNKSKNNKTKKANVNSKEKEEASSRKAKEDAERKEKEEDTRKEKEEANRKEKEEATRKEKEEAERKEEEQKEDERRKKEKEESDRIEKEDAERRKKEKEEADRIKEEATRKAKEEAERQEEEQKEDDRIKEEQKEDDRIKEEEDEKRKKEKVDRLDQEEADRIKEEDKKRIEEADRLKTQEEPEKNTNNESHVGGKRKKNKKTKKYKSKKYKNNKSIKN